MARSALAIGAFIATLAAACGKTADPTCDEVGKHLADVGREGEGHLAAFRSDDERAELARSYAEECSSKRYIGSVRRCLLKASTVPDIAQCISDSSTAPTPSGLDVKPGWVVTGDRVSVDSLASAPAGNVAVAGTVDGKGTFAGRELTSASEQPFVAMLSTKGTLIWIRTFELPSTGVHVAVAQDGTVWMSGITLKPSNELGPDLKIIGKPRDDSPTGFLIAWSSTGDLIHQFAIPGAHLGPLAVTSEGDVVIASTVRGKIDVGGGGRECGGSGVLVARFRPDGGHVWSSCASTPNDFNPSADQETKIGALVSDEKEVLLCGRFSTDLSFGTTIKPYAPDSDSRPQPDLFVASLDSARGTPRWLQGHGGPAQQDCHGLAPVPNGVVVAAEGGHELLDRPHDDYSYTEPTVLRYDAAGKREWGWVDERHMGGARMVSVLSNGRVAAVLDDDYGASLVLLDAGHLLARATLNGESGPLHEQHVRIHDAVNVSEGTLFVGGEAFRAPSDGEGQRVVPHHSFVGQLSVRAQ